MKISRRFGYKLSNELCGIDGGGSTGSWANRVAKIYGSCSQESCPDDAQYMTDEEYRGLPITFEAYLEASQHKIPYFQRLYTLEDCKKALFFSKSFMIAFDCFESIYTAPNGNVPYPKLGEKQIGSHAVLVMGGIEKEQLFQFINSWGTEWGNKGWGTLPFSFLEDGLIHECWCFGGMMNNYKVRNERIFKLETKKKKKFDLRFNIYKPLRASKYNIFCFDIYQNNVMIGFLLASLYEAEILEIEDFFILPQFQDQGFGTKVILWLETLSKWYSFKKIIGWISSQDLINNREDRVLYFFKKNKYKLIEDDSRFRDAYYKFEKILPTPTHSTSPETTDSTSS